MTTSENKSTLNIMRDCVKESGQLAIAILNAFKFNWKVPDDRISASVENGWVTLEGELQWPYQSAAAVNAVKNIKGVMGVYNHISIKPILPELAEIRM